MMDDDDFRPLKRRRGGRLYSGCSTCRMRKIKCDKRQPTCFNCERSRRYVCNGYGDQDEVPSVPATNHRGYHITTTTFDEEADVDHDGGIERLLRGLNDQAGVISWGSFSPTASDDPFPLAWDDGELLHQNDDEFSGSLQQEEVLSPPATVLEPLAHSDSNTTEFLDDVAINEPVQEAVKGPEMAEESVRVLVHHWQTHVCHLMMPTMAPSRNPWLRLYLPIALQEPRTCERSCLLYAILSTASFNKAELQSPRNQDSALAFRRRGREFQAQAESLLESAMDVLSSASTTTDKQALLAAALTMTSVEVFSGEGDGKCYHNLLIARRIVRSTGGPDWWLSDVASTTIFQNFRCLQIIAFTSGWTPEWRCALPATSLGGRTSSKTPRPSRLLEQIAYLDEKSKDTTPSPLSLAPPACEYTLDITFGISMTTLRCLNKIQDLVSKAMVQISGDAQASPPLSWSESHIQEFVQLESEIFAVLDDPDAFSGQQSPTGPRYPGLSDYVSGEIMENHVWAFHCSTAVFLRRALCQGLPTIGPLLGRASSHRRPTGQQLVQKALEHLENVDALSSDITIANTLWPGFIAAVEAVDMELRHRALIWFSRAQYHGIGNIAKAKALVMEVWRQVDRQSWTGSDPRQKSRTQELSPVDWRAVMRDKGMYIMLT